MKIINEIMNNEIIMKISIMNNNDNNEKKIIMKW